MNNFLPMLLVFSVLTAGSGSWQQSSSNPSPKESSTSKFANQAAFSFAINTQRFNVANNIDGRPPPFWPLMLPLQYINRAYGFTFFLPASWEGFSIVSENWKGYAIIGPQGAGEVDHGAVMVIRHPPVTSELPYQDIPIMIFTLAQWDDLLDKVPYHDDSVRVHKFSVDAGGYVWELGRNDKYVFAMRSRYDANDAEGIPEVVKIIAQNPLLGF